MHGCSRKQQPAVTSKSARSVPVAASARQHTPAATHGQPRGFKSSFCSMRFFIGSPPIPRLLAGQNPLPGVQDPEDGGFKFAAKQFGHGAGIRQGSTAAPGGPAGAGAGPPDDYLIRLAARFEAVAADDADDAARELATVHPVSTSGVAFKLFAYVIGERESALAEETEKWVRGGMYDTIAANRPDNASSSRDKDRAVQSSQGLAATEAALQWARSNRQWLPTSSSSSRPGALVPCSWVDQRRPCAKLCFCWHSRRFATTCPRLTPQHSHPPQARDPSQSKAGSYSGGCPYPHDSANAATAYNVASWIIVIVSHFACVYECLCECLYVCV